MILVAGGDVDPNLGSLLGRLEERGIPHRSVLVGADSHPRATWDVQQDRMEIDGEELRVGGAFIRHDVFTHMADPRQATASRASAWYATVQGWLLAHEEIRLLNRGGGKQMNKPYYLYLARRAGLEIPETVVSNDLEYLERRSQGHPMIAKPVPGGGYAQPLEELLASTPRRDGRSASPGIVQQRLEQPEVRIYSVGGRFIPFAVKSDVLDYRTSPETRVEHLPLEQVQPGLAEGLGRLMEILGMDYGAADFKTDPATGRLLFLELNSSPMFVAFDAVSGHAVSDAIIDFLQR